MSPFSNYTKRDTLKSVSPQNGAPNRHIRQKLKIYDEGPFFIRSQSCFILLYSSLIARFSFLCDFFIKKLTTILTTVFEKF